MADQVTEKPDISAPAAPVTEDTKVEQFETTGKEEAKTELNIEGEDCLNYPLAGTTCMSRLIGALSRVFAIMFASSSPSPRRVHATHQISR